MLKRIRTLFRKANHTSGNEIEPANKPGHGADAAARPDVHVGPRIIHRPIDEVDLDPDAVKIVQRLTRFEHRAYLVGGCVRDLLLERSPKDFDIATSATPRQIKRLFRNCRIIGRRFRLAHIYFHGGKIIEVATFRAVEESRPDEGDDDGGDLMIRDDNVFGSPEDDALRRDFTINALFYDVAEGNVIDHVDGLGDLRRRLVRTIGEPEIRFREDPIRMLRAIKFAARLDLEIEPSTRAAIEAVRDEIPRAAAARIIEELHRFFREGSARRAFNLLLDTGVLEVVLPELTQELTADPARRELVGSLLADADERRAAGGELRMGAMFAALLLPGLAEPFGWHADGSTDPPVRNNPRTIIDRRLSPVAERLRVPRREQEHCRQTLMSLARMVPADRVRRATLRSILARESRDDSIALLAILAETWGGEFVEALSFWRDAVAEGGARARQHDATPEDEADADGSEAPRARRRRSRGGRRRRGKRGDASGGEAAGESHDDRAEPAASADDGRREQTPAATRSMPSPWDDRYFFAALPSVPERKEGGDGRDTGAVEATPDADADTGSEADGVAADTAARPRRRRSRGGRRRRRGGGRDDADAGDATDAEGGDRDES